MARGQSNTALVSFNAGEFSPKLEGRVDLDKAKSGCRVLENFIIEHYGEARRRPGTKYVAKVQAVYSSGS